jgi:restriction system protein
MKCQKYFNTNTKIFSILTLQALKNLGGSASISEIEDELSKILNLSDEEINDIHKESRTKLSYRLAWARIYLKNAGLLENSKRGVWVLTQKGDQAGWYDQCRAHKERIFFVNYIT